MRVDDLIRESREQEELRILKTRCSQFLEDSNSLPLLKNLPETYGDFHKVKVRKRKGEDDFTETFNEAFEEEHTDLWQRAVFANGLTSFEPEDGDFETFFIFPINGYKYMYCAEVENSSQEYKQVFDNIFEEFGSEKGQDVITDLLRFTYVQEELDKGIETGAEIVIYNIPFYYAIRTSSIGDYDALLTEIQEVD